jgi:hypothetical protein
VITLGRRVVAATAGMAVVLAVMMGVVVGVVVGAPTAAWSQDCPVPPCPTLPPTIPAQPQRELPVQPVPVAVPSPPFAPQPAGPQPFRSTPNSSASTWIALLAGMAVTLAMVRTLAHERRATLERRRSRADSTRARRHEATRT